jgi:hypothetical protein
MPLQNWAAGAAPLASALALVPALGVALLLPQPLNAKATTASASGSFINGLDIALALPNLTCGIEGADFI